MKTMRREAEEQEGEEKIYSEKNTGTPKVIVRSHRRGKISGKTRQLQQVVLLMLVCLNNQDMLKMRFHILHFCMSLKHVHTGNMTR